MFSVIFRARLNPDISEQSYKEYSNTAQKLRQKALTEYNCIEFTSAFEDGQEIAISYWHSEKDILAWKQDKDHRIAQQQGVESWYSDYQIEIVEVVRRYSKK